METKKLTRKDIEDLVTSSFKILSIGKRDLADFNSEVQYLGVLTEMLLLKVLCLKLSPSLSKNQKLSIASDNFAAIKSGIQAAIESGFEGATYKISNMTLDYICSIKPVDESKSIKCH